MSNKKKKTMRFSRAFGASSSYQVVTELPAEKLKTVQAGSRYLRTIGEATEQADKERRHRY